MFDALFPLEIFPQGSLTGSVITTVWVGVFVVAFFNLRLGWVLSGLVVPGYLVPLLLIKPWSVAAILIEGVTAYYLVWLFSEYFSRRGLWSALFGRDRFFALILASIVTRVTFDGWLLPIFGAWMNDLGLVFDYRNELHSLGLVIVALVANQFWKTGVLRGLPPLLIALFVTWSIVNYLLIPFTNFGLGGISYMYEDLAASILASPKAYIILVTTAFVASRMNLRYGWDFNGILIPSLLALQWYEPLKVLVSFGEAFIILALAILTLKTPLFANATIEGARKLLLFFNIAFIYKILLSYLLLYFAPEIKVSDYFAFGYLLSTLLAIKMHDKGIAIRMTRATLQTSLVSVFIASVIGYALTMLPHFQPWVMSSNQPVAMYEKISDETLIDRIISAKPEIYRAKFASMYDPMPQEIDAFTVAMKHLKSYSLDRKQVDLDKAVSFLKSVDYKIELLENRFLFISSADIDRNWGIFVINLDAENELLVEVPSPLEERGLIDSAASLFISLNARSFSIGNSDSSEFYTRTLSDSFYRVTGRRNVLQVHAYTKEFKRILSTARTTTANSDAGSLSGELWVKNRLPPGLDLSRLELLVGRFEVNWGELDYPDLVRDDSREGFAEIFLNRKGLQRPMIGALLDSLTTEFRFEDQRIDGFLQEWLLGSKKQIAQSGTDEYQVPELQELLFMDEEVISPLLSIMKTGYQNGDWTSDALVELQAINTAAAVLGYELIRYRHKETNNDYLILSESESDDRRYWGTYVFRLGSASPFVIQSPRPLFEVNSFEVAVSLFERMNAKALLIGGTHPLTNRDYTSDLVRSSNQRSLFTLVNQVVMRDQDKLPLLSIQCRALGLQYGSELPDADMLVSFDDGAMHTVSFNELQKQLISTLSANRWNLRYVDGSLATSGYQVGGTPQARYVNAGENKGFALLWVSPLVRSSFKQQQLNDGLSVQFSSLGINSIQSDVYDYIKELTVESINNIDSGLLDDVRLYQETNDIILLTKIMTNSGQLVRIIDKHTKQAYLLVYNDALKLIMLANLNPINFDTQRVAASEKITREILNKYIESRTANLVFE